MKLLQQQGERITNMNKSGFSIVEIIIVTVIVFISSVGLYVTVTQVLAHSEQISKYDSAKNVYNLNTIKVFLYKNYDVNKLCNYVYDEEKGEYKTFPILNITSGKEIYNLDIDAEKLKMFKSITNDMNIKTLIFAEYSNILSGTDSTTTKIKSDAGLYKYINYILDKNPKNSDDKLLYLLIAEFNDNTYASINMYKVRR
ncbi:MAG: hypothetical protein E7166_05840 [Firmicutes bacterium]|nr:hypothetical protein [Bacillota bacterium]